MMTVQAPQAPSSQATFSPVRPRRSRNTSASVCEAVMSWPRTKPCSRPLTESKIRVIESSSISTLPSYWARAGALEPRYWARRSFRSSSSVPRAFVDDRAVAQDVRAVGELQDLIGVLLHDQDGETLIAQRPHQTKDLVHQQGREAERRLVEQKQPRPRHHSPRDGELLRLAS